MEKVSDELKIHIQSYLDYESIIELSKTNKRNHDLYQIVKKKELFPLLSTQKYYIYRNYTYKINSYFFTAMFAKVISYDPITKTVVYINLPYGREEKNLWPVDGTLFYCITHDITYPHYQGSQHTSIVEFKKEYRLYTPHSSLYFLYIFHKSLFIYLFVYTPILILVVVCYLFYYLLLPLITLFYFMILLLLATTFVEMLFHSVHWSEQSWI